jgi:hypothetical protein
LVGLIFGKVAIWFIGLLILGGGCYYGLGPEGILRKDQVIDNWAILIEKGQDRGEAILRDTEAFVKENKAPSLEMARQQIAPGAVKEIVARKRNR